jgi:hypothetical protein
MLVYYFDEKNIYTGQTEETELCPSNATTLVPPHTLDGTYAEWIGDCWCLKEIIVITPVPTVHILSVVGGIYDPAKSEFTVESGTQFTVSCEIKLGDQKLPITDTFRMPIQSLDGREKLLLIKVRDGDATLVWTPKDSGTWIVSEQLMNRDLPQANHMSFSGLKIFVVEV